jgi:hypothetical protein
MDARKLPGEESLRLELQEALVTFRHWTTQANQAAGVVATGDALLVAYGFSQRLAGVLFLASAMPLLVLLVYLLVMDAAASLINLAMRLERRLSIHKDSLAATYANIHLRPLVSQYGGLENLNDEELLDLDRNTSMRRWLRKQIPILLYMGTVVQIALAILSLTVYHYRFI